MADIDPQLSPAAQRDAAARQMLERMVAHAAANATDRSDGPLAIPATLYTAVAQVLAYVYRLKAALRGDGRMPEAMAEPQVPPELDPHHKMPAARGAA